MSDSGQPTDYTASKAALRTRLLARRRALSEQARADAATRIQAALASLLAEFRPTAGSPGAPLTVTGFVPFGAEPGGPALPTVLAGHLPAGGQLLLPVLLPDLGLDWARYDGRLAPGGRGPAEPAGPRLGPAAIGEASLVVVPAVAVDQRGVRLGRGGGSYDRALAQASPGALVVALLYDGELLERLPAEPHDQRVSGVITPTHGWTRLPTG